jgi:LPS export ABC transporter protein LptC
VLAVCLASAAGAAACKDTKQPPVAASASLADSAEQVLYKVRSLITNSGVQRGELLADTAYVFNDQTKFVMRVVHVNFNKETGIPNGTMRADRGIYDLRAQFLEGFGNVVIKTTDGKTLSAPQLRYNQVANLVSSDSAFQMTDGSRKQSGVGFTSDPNLTRFTCMKKCGGSAPIVIPTQ